MRLLLFIFGALAVSVSAQQARKCPSGWYPYGAFCYFFSDAVWTFGEARSICRQRQGDLSSIANAGERNFLRNRVRQLRQSFWLGMTAINTKDKTAKWLDNTKWNKGISIWAKNEPNNWKNQEKCGHFRADGLWNDNNCNQRMRYICKRRNTIVDKCDLDAGWHPFGAKCYKFFEGASEWRGAREQCQRFDGDLMVVDNANKLRYIQDTVTCKDTKNVVWLGLSDIESPGQLKWTNGGGIVTNNWDGGQPQTIVQGDTCVEVVSTANYKWRTTACSAERKYICERPQGKCPRGWLEWSGTCYQLNTAGRVRRTWTDAVNFCKNQGTSILQIISGAEQNSIVATISRRLVAQRLYTMWLGISDRDKDGTFTWADGSQITYKAWAGGQPKDVKGRYDCAFVLTRNNKRQWSSGYCFVKRPFVCKMPLIQSLGNGTQEVTHQCMDKGWKNFKNTCYLFSTTKNKWIDAQKDCQAKGGNLASIPDANVQSFISGNLPWKGWIGLNDRDTEGQFMWAAGNMKANFLNWGPGEPNNAGNNEDCVELSGPGGAVGQWNDLNCDRVLNYICEKEASPLLALSSPKPTLPFSQDCGPYWVFDSSSQFCYQINVETPLSWTAARSQCVKNGGDLLALGVCTSKHSCQATSGATNFWIGANDRDLKGGWRWSDSAAFRFFNWNPGAPDNRNGQDCVNIQTVLQSKWVSAKCNEVNPYICKKMSVNQTTPTPMPMSTPAPLDCKAQAMISGNHYVQNYLLTASSSVNAAASPQRSRFNTVKEGSNRGGWQARVNSNQQWIQVDFLTPIVVKAIVTRGMQDASNWVRSYRIYYKYDSQSTWQWYQEGGRPKTIVGNTDQNSQKRFDMAMPFQARYVRLYPMSWYNNIGLRWEVWGCITDDCRAEKMVTGTSIVPDEKLTASTSYDNNHGPQNSRLHNIRQGLARGGWSALNTDNTPWIQADFGLNIRVRGFITQGRQDMTQWVTQYKVSFSLDGRNFMWYQEPWKTVKLFVANRDQNTQRWIWLGSPFMARFVRIHPTQWKTHPSLRWEVLGCAVGCQPVGLISGPHRILNKMITASSVFDGNHNAARSRLWSSAAGSLKGAWAPKFANKNQYIQVDLGTIVYIKAIATRGRQDSDQWVKKYIAAYSKDGKTWYAHYVGGKRRVYDGNWDRNTIRKNFLESPFSARYVRLWPQEWQNFPSLRWELYGCPGPLGGTLIGCFADNWRNRDLPNSPMWNPPGGITPRICVNHCYHQGYNFAGVQNGRACFCGNTYGTFGPSTTCNVRCAGSPRQFCGGPNTNSIYSTGIAAAWLRCAEGWTTYGDNCYKIFTDKSNWDGAKTKCRQQGGDLVSINSQHEMDFALSMISKVKQNIWIGLNDLRIVRLFEWSDNSDVLYTNWARNEPNNWQGRQEQCVHTYGDSGQWNDEMCNRRYSYMCMKGKESAEEPKTTPPPTGCQQGWKAWNWNCYIFLPTPRNWNDASRTCRSFGSNLVRVEDRFEQAYLSSELGNLDGFYWTDLTDRTSPGIYKWSNGESNIPFTNWALGQPDDRNGKCASMGTGDSAGLWYDQQCQVRRGTLCKKLRVGFTRPPTPKPTVALGPCDQGWIQWGNNCFQVNAVDYLLQKSWTDALADCRAKGADLASFHNDTEHEFVWKNNIVGTNQHFWTGLNNRDTKKGHVWSDGTPVAFTNWADGEPNNANGQENCVEMYRDTGLWNDLYCDRQRNWICKIPRGKPVISITTTPAPTAGPAGSCSPDNDDWKFYKGKCYYFSSGVGVGSKNWREAEQYCNTQNAYLVSIHNNDEQNFVQGQAKALSQGAMWIGLNELDIMDGYKWTDGTPNNFQKWAPNEPNDWNGNEACVNLRNINGEWNDEHCSVSIGFICMKYKGGTPPPRTTQPPLPGNCPKGFKEFGNKCFQFNTEMPDDQRLNWDDARKKCQSMSSGSTYKYDLASIANEKEQAFITAHMNGVKNNAWVGLKHLRGQSFMWIDNSDVTYTNWWHGEPNGGVNEQCVEVWRENFRAGKWNDVTCDNNLGYICQTYKQANLITAEPTPNNCPKDFIPYGKGCYLIIRSARDWDSSKTYCVQQNAKLVSITSPYEGAFVYSLMNLDQINSDIWIGLSDKFNPGHFRWADNWPVLYTKWDKNQPSRPQGGCVSLRQNGKWSDIDCNSRLPAVCKYTTEEPPVTPAPLTGTCPEKDGDDVWLPFGTNCYLFKNIDRSWIEADYECVNREAQLASAHSDEEVQFLVNHVTPFGKNIWLGLLKTRTKGFTWKDGTVLQFTNWASGEPSDKDGTQNEDCVEMYQDGKWNDNSCYAKRAYACKVPQRIAGSTILVPDKSAPPGAGSTNPPGPVTDGPVGPATAFSPGRSQPTFKRPTVGPTLKPWNPGQAQQQASTSVGGVTGGEIAGIILALVAIIGLIAFAVILFRRGSNSGGKFEGSIGFDNALYQPGSDSIQVQSS